MARCIAFERSSVRLSPTEKHVQQQQEKEKEKSKGGSGQLMRVAVESFFDRDGLLIDSFESIRAALTTVRGAFVADSSVPPIDKIRQSIGPAINAGEILTAGGNTYTGVPIEDVPTS
mmetsp:Transcript_23979/g.68926  ORF Transcript_23979/g.68926 Transcript_23979/m.68926 type:complete len:117 (+) Transcript_23979:464-814(+)